MTIINYSLQINILTILLTFNHVVLQVVGQSRVQPMGGPSGVTVSECVCVFNSCAFNLLLNHTLVYMYMYVLMGVNNMYKKLQVQPNIPFKDTPTKHSSGSTHSIKYFSLFSVYAISQLAGSGPRALGKGN